MQNNALKNRLIIKSSEQLGDRAVVNLRPSAL